MSVDNAWSWSGAGGLYWVLLSGVGENTQGITDLGKAW